MKSLKAEILRMQAELTQLKAAAQNVFGADFLSMPAAIARAEKAEAELEELRDAVAWYFECRYTPFIEELPLKKGGFGWFRTPAQDFHARTEFIETRKHAEKELRELIGGEL